MCTRFICDSLVPWEVLTLRSSVLSFFLSFSLVTHSQRERGEERDERERGRGDRDDREGETEGGRERKRDERERGVREGETRGRERERGGERWSEG